MKLPYEEFDLSGVKTYPLRSRESKVNLAQFATPYKKGTGVDGLLKTLPALLAASDFKAVVQALITARQAGRAIIWGLGAHDNSSAAHGEAVGSFASTITFFSISRLTRPSYWKGM